MFYRFFAKRKREKKGELKRRSGLIFIVERAATAKLTNFACQHSMENV